MRIPIRYCLIFILLILLMTYLPNIEWWISTPKNQEITENIDKNIERLENLGEDLIINKIDPPHPKFTTEISEVIQESENDFLSGSLNNLTVNSDGNLVLEKYNINNWKDITSSGPSERYGHAMAYDSKHNKVVLFGGRNNDWEFFYDTWVYDLETNTWTEIDIPEMFPDPRIYHAMIYSPAAERILLFGGENEWEEILDDLWVFDLGTNTWDLAHYDSSPSHIYGRGGHSLVYDPFEEKVYLFGGYSGYSFDRTYYQDTWLLEYYGDSYAYWYNVTPSTGPSVRAFHSMTTIYNSTENPMDRYAILYGGEVDYIHGDGIIYDDTWIYDFNRWTQIFPASSPEERFGHTAIYDSMTPQVLLYGGYSPDIDETCSDTWVFNISTSSWIQKSPSAHPEGRFFHSMVHIPNSNVSLIFGGYDPSSHPDVYFSDTWAYLTNNYYETGSFLSQITDFGHIYNIQGNLSWNIPNSPLNTSLEIQIGFSNTTNDENFQFNPVLASESSFSNLAQYIRYHVHFHSNFIQNSTPWIEWVNISYTLVRPAPFVEITNPLNNSQVMGEILISAESMSPNGIANVSFLIDDVLQVTLFSLPYQFLWNSEMAENNGINITATAATILGQTNSCSIQVEVYNQLNRPPTPPQNLSAIGGENNISLTWDPPLDTGGSPIIQYRIYRGSQFFTEYLLVGISTLTSFTDTTVNRGILYYYVVTAENSNGESNFSEMTSAYLIDTPSITPPSAPSDLSASIGYNYVELSWIAPENDGGSSITGYRVYRGIQSEEYTVIFLSATTNYVDTLVEASSTYYYVVSAENEIGDSTFSLELTITTPSLPSPSTVPDAPISVIANAGENYVELDWNAPENDGGSLITSYRVYRGVQSGEYTLIFVTTETNYNDSLVLGETTYYYVVTAKNIIGESPYSLEVDATPTGVTIPQSGAFPDILSIIAILTIGVIVIGKKRKKNRNYKK